MCSKDVRRVPCEKWVGGVVVSSRPVPFRRKESANTENNATPNNRRYKLSYMLTSIAGNMGDRPDKGQNMDGLEGGATASETAILDDDVNGVPNDHDPYTLVTSKAVKRRAAQAAHQSEWQNKVSASNFILAEQIKTEAVVIVKPVGDEGSELISSSKARKLALDKSPFKSEGILQVTPNHAKKLFVVSVPASANVHKLCQINNLGGFLVKCYLPFNIRVESCVIQNAE